MTKSKSIVDVLREYSSELEKVDEWSEMSPILVKIESFINGTFDSKYADIIKSLNAYQKAKNNKAGYLGFIEGLIAKIENQSSEKKITSEENNSSKKSTSSEIINLKKVFIVHGRDNEVKEIVARFVEKIGLNSIILHEKPNSGRTIIEKFELFSDVSYAVVLLTPDDLGYLESDESQLRSRARQNVILELGYFMGKLGRNNVCALVKDDVELPSDYHGILYIKFDSSGAWKTKLAQEFIQAKLEIKVEALLS